MKVNMKEMLRLAKLSPIYEDVSEIKEASSQYKKIEKVADYLDSFQDSITKCRDLLLKIEREAPKVGVSKSGTAKAVKDVSQRLNQIDDILEEEIGGDLIALMADEEE